MQALILVIKRVPATGNQIPGYIHEIIHHKQI